MWCRREASILGETLVDTAVGSKAWRWEDMELLSSCEVESLMMQVTGSQFSG